VQRNDNSAPEERKQPAVAEAALRKEEGSKRNNQEVPEMAARQQLLESTHPVAWALSRTTVQ